MGIDCTVRIAKKFLEVKNILKGIRKFYTDFLELYRITYPKLEAILNIPKKSWEKKLALVEGDHWLMETWKLGLYHRKEVLERLFHEVELDIDWAKEIRVVCEEYPRLMTEFDSPIVELDPEKIKLYFHKNMENETTDALMLDFMGFTA